MNDQVLMSGFSMMASLSRQQHDNDNDMTVRHNHLWRPVVLVLSSVLLVWVCCVWCISILGAKEKFIPQAIEDLRPLSRRGTNSRNRYVEDLIHVLESKISDETGPGESSHQLRWRHPKTYARSAYNLNLNPSIPQSSNPQSLPIPKILNP